MLTPPLVHDIPFPPVLRSMLTLMGAFLLFIVPYDLGRGIWPPNILTPVFGSMVSLGMGMGALLIFGGLFSPSMEYYFSRDGVLIKSQFLRGNSEVFHPIANISGVTHLKESSSDGPDNWYAVVNMTDRKPLRSRPFQTEPTARNVAAEFKAALGLAG